MEDQGEGDRAVGVAGVFRELVRSGGVGVLFQGATARVLWLMAFTTVYLQVYEMLTRETPHLLCLCGCSYGSVMTQLVVC